MRILLIEDNEDDAYLIREALTEFDAPTFDLEWVDRIERGLACLSVHEVHAVLVDLSLPDSNGLATFDEVYAKAPNVPIVVLTGLDDESVAVEAVRKGAQDYLVKKRLDRDTLVRAIRYAVERKQAELALQQSEAQLRQAQKLESIGRLAGGVAHDFNNLLTVINSYSQMMLDEIKFDNAFVRTGITQIREAGHRAALLTRQLLAFSRNQVLELKIVDLNVVVSNMTRLLRRLVDEDIHFVVCPDPSLGRIKADPGQIEQVLMNLVVNAKDAMPEGGQLIIETANIQASGRGNGNEESLEPGSYVLLTVSDTGCGMDAQTQARIFEPFFTTKEPGKGTGLGLSTVYGIVKQSGGGISVSSVPGRGTTFRIYFPRVEGEAEIPTTRPVSKAMSQGRETVLLVEDDDMVRALTQTILQSHGYTVLPARQAKEALHLVEEHPARIDLLVSDMVMPGLSGPELAQRLLSVRSEMKVLFTSGYMEKAKERFNGQDLSTTFIQKPFTPETLTRKVRDVLDTPRPHDQSGDAQRRMNS